MRKGNHPRADGAMATVARTAMSLPLLDKGRELALARRWRDHGDEAALRELTGAYLRLVISMAGRHRNYGLPVSDLVQEGTVGLMKAAERFEPSRNVRFSTYARWWIRSAIQDFILRNWSIVRTGTTAAHKSLFFKLRGLRAALGHEVDGPMSHQSRHEISRRLGVRVRDVEIMEARLSAVDGSLNAPISGEGAGIWQDSLRDPRPTPEEVVQHGHDLSRQKKWLGEALADLSDRERMIIRERRLGEETVTLAALGGVLGISKERVRQIEQRALAKLRFWITRRMNERLNSAPA